MPQGGNFFNLSPRGGSLQQPKPNEPATMSAVVDDRYTAVRLKPFAIENLIHQNTPMANIRGGIGSHG